MEISKKIKKGIKTTKEYHGKYQDWHKKHKKTFKKWGKNAARFSQATQDVAERGDYGFGGFCFGDYNVKSRPRRSPKRNQKVIYVYGNRPRKSYVKVKRPSKRRRKRSSNDSLVGGWGF